MARIDIMEDKEYQSKRDIGAQLDGVIRDMLSWWENVKFQRANNLDE